MKTRTRARAGGFRGAGELTRVVGTFIWTEVALADLVHRVWMLAATSSSRGSGEAGMFPQLRVPRWLVEATEKVGGGGGMQVGVEEGWCTPVFENRS